MIATPEELTMRADCKTQPRLAHIDGRCRQGRAQADNRTQEHSSEHQLLVQTHATPVMGHPPVQPSSRSLLPERIHPASLRFGLLNREAWAERDCVRRTNTSASRSDALTMLDVLRPQRAAAGASHTAALRFVGRAILS